MYHLWQKVVLETIFGFLSYLFPGSYGSERFKLVLSYDKTNLMWYQMLTYGDEDDRLLVCVVVAVVRSVDV